MSSGSDGSLLKAEADAEAALLCRHTGSIVVAYGLSLASLMVQTIKIHRPMQEIRVRFLDQEDPLEKGMATHSSILAPENSMDRGAWQATVHGVIKGRT